MSNKQTPRHSLHQALDASDPLKIALGQMEEEQQQATVVTFNDEFAPSSSPVADLADTGVLQTKAGRMVHYNDHVIDYMEGALDRACELGVPRLPWFFPLQYPSVSDAQFRIIAPMVGALCDDLEEQSDDWLALKCYLCWLQACHALTEGASILYVADQMFTAGATAREFELSVRNRRHAASGRKQHKNLKELRESKNSRAKQAVNNRRRLVACLMAETRLNGGALDQWLVRQLAERHGIRVSQRTIRSDLKAVRG